MGPLLDPFALLDLSGMRWDLVASAVLLAVAAPRVGEASPRPRNAATLPGSSLDLRGAIDASGTIVAAILVSQGEPKPDAPGQAYVDRLELRTTRTLFGPVRLEKDLAYTRRTLPSASAETVPTVGKAYLFFFAPPGTGVRRAIKILPASELQHVVRALGDREGVRKPSDLVVPRRIVVRRTAQGVGIALDSRGGRRVTLDVNPRLVLGRQTELSIVRDGKQIEHRIGLSSGPETTGDEDLFAGLPAPGDAPGSLLVTVHVTVFETDVKAGHMWDPTSGRYAGLWEEDLTARF